MNWHARYAQQARWTKPLRDYLFEKTGLAAARRVLEVGCGTGALLAEMPKRTFAADHGLDISLSAIKQAQINSPTSTYILSDAHHIPYAAESFDIVYCHFVLLWVRDPLAMLIEMRRITRKGGYVIVMAEPDYTRRIDAPETLIPLGQMQTKSLRKQGADPAIGSRLGELFYNADIILVENGELKQGASDSFALDEWELEWAVLESDLADMLSEEDLQNFKALDRAAWDQRARKLYVPTFYAYGRA